MKTRGLLLWLLAIVLLLVVNVLIIQKEQLAANGRVVLLALAPVDPRSLIQGDYMQLRYALENEAGSATSRADGYWVVRLDENNVASFSRVHAGEPLAADEVQLRYRERNYDVNVGPEAYFFQEGHAEYYEDARYGELRVDAAGGVLLVGLRGEDFRVLGPP
jgi:uncharacterized membrane-anchored protein